jgi:hypothetical protein
MANEIKAPNDYLLPSSPYSCTAILRQLTEEVKRKADPLKASRFDNSK